MSAPSAETFLAESVEFHARGDHFNAHDAAMRGLAVAPEDRRLQHRAVLSLTNAGARSSAERLYRGWGLSEWLEPSHPLPERLDLNLAALGARFLKEAAFARRVPAAADLGRAAAAYQSIFERTQEVFPAVNAATLHFLAGNATGAAALAGRVLELTAASAPASDEYWRLASRVEALLVLRRIDEAAAVAGQALSAVGRRWGDLASTRRQLRHLVEALGVTARWSASLQPPRVIHYTGHVALEAAQLPQVAGQLEALLDARPVGVAYGSLAAGADLLFAEALLARGAALHVVLPFTTEEFLQTSVRPSGPQWVERFHRALAGAADVRHATADAFLGDSRLYTYGSRLAMGLAVLRAEQVQAEVEQLAVWDGRPASRDAGTAVDVEAWRLTGRAQTVIAVPPAAAPPPALEPGPVVTHARQVRAMLFGDVVGFSKLIDYQIPPFVQHVLGLLAEVLAHHQATMLKANTWGDGLFTVFEGAEAAAACALELQARFDALDPVALGLPAQTSMRLGGHVGPIYRLHDPVQNTLNFFGAHVSRAARIEPVTPPGRVYVTEAFAAEIALLPHSRFEAEYVGVVSAAKGYGAMRMFVLTERR